MARRRRRAHLAGALPLLKRAKAVTILSVGSEDARTPTQPVIDDLAQHGIAAASAGLDPGEVTSRGRGRALIDYAFMTDVGLMVMGAFGEPSLMSFLGLGRATGKVISGTRTPLLVAR